MKKILFLLLVFLVLATMLVSCKKEKTTNELLLEISDEKERAMEISTYCEEKAETYTSFKTITEMNLVLSITESVYKSEQIQVDIGTSDFYYYNKDVISVNGPGSNVTEITNVKAYKDGKMFVEYDNSETWVEQKIFSKVSLPDFLKHISDDSGFNNEDCRDVECALNDDGSWTIIYSGYYRNAIVAFLDRLGMKENIFGPKVYDIEQTFEIDKDFNIVSHEVVFDFETENSKFPKLSISTTITDIDTAKKVKINEEDYKKVDSIFMLDGFEDEMATIAGLKEGYITITDEQEVMFQQEVTNTTLSEANAEYGIKPDGKYFYKITIPGRKEDTTITYNNGFQIEKLGLLQIQKNSQTEKEAKEYLKDYILEVVNYDKNRITSIVKNTDGSYILSTENPDITDIEIMLEEVNVTLIDKTEQQFIISYDEEDVISSIVRITKVRAYVNGLPYILEQVMTFTVQQEVEE